MMLEEYQKKRDFKKTKEPRGKEKTSGGKIYVIQKHQARRLHYDLRLEMDGVLKSWAVPKEPPAKQGIKRLAVKVEDHPIDYASFEGLIPEGQYGAGNVEIWDKGTFDLESRKDWKIIFHIKGKKLKGRYCLVQLKNQKKNWLFFKIKEE